MLSERGFNQGFKAKAQLAHTAAVLVRVSAAVMNTMTNMVMMNIIMMMNNML